MVVIGYVGRPRGNAHGNRRFAGRLLGNDVDDAGQGIGTVLGRGGTADDFDTLDGMDVQSVEGQQVLCRRRIFNGRPLAVDQDKGTVAGHAAHGNAVTEAGAGIHDLYIIGQPQGRIDVGGA